MSGIETQQIEATNPETKVDEQKQSVSGDILNTLDYKGLKKFNEEMESIYGKNPTPEKTLEILKGADIYKDCKNYDEAMILLKDGDKNGQGKNANLYHRLKDNVKDEKTNIEDNKEGSKIKSNERMDLKGFCTLGYSNKLEEGDIVINIKGIKGASPIFRLEEGETGLFYCVNYPKSYPEKIYIEALEKLKSEYPRQKTTSDSIKNLMEIGKETDNVIEEETQKMETKPNQETDSIKPIIENQKKEKIGLRNKIKSKRKKFRNIK